jgi:hypothetical protein
LTYHYTHSNGCSSSAQQWVNVMSVPITVNNSGPVCVGGNLELGSSGGTSYSWVGPNGFTSNQQNPTISNVAMSHAGAYTVHATGANGCTEEASTTLVVNPPPVVHAEGNSPVKMGDTIQLSGTGGVTFDWDGPDSFTSGSQTPLIPNAQIENSGIYTLTATDSNACSSLASVQVFVRDTSLSVGTLPGKVSVGAT